MPALRLEKRPDGVAVLWFDSPDSPVNTLSRAYFGEFAAAIDDLLGDPAVKACVLASAKRDNFIAGANLHEVVTITRPEEAEQLSREGQSLLARLESSPKPIVAAIHGAALGGGLEVALACQYRLASDDPKTVLALPEVQLGLLPGLGGTQRLPKLIGLERSLPMLLTGSRLRAKKAQRYGLVDAVAGPFGLVETACKAALRLADGTLKPKRDHLPAMERVLGLAPARRMLFSKARQDVLKRTGGHYPAPLSILACVEAAFEQGVQAGYATEARLFGKLVASPEAKSLIWLFQAMTELKKAPDAELAHPVKRLGVIGAGLMGQGIASVSLEQWPVVVRDVGAEALGRAAKATSEGLQKRMRSGALSAADRDRLWSQVRFTTGVADLKGCDLVIEAVFEDLALKRKVVAELESAIAPDAVIASNTSALPIRAIAAEARHPERIVGMHYFSPVPKMPLLEIVRAPESAPWAIATARSAGIAQGKTVIVVADGPGFYTTRILAPYMNEALLLLAEGAEIGALDRALKDFGFPVGPVALMDEVGLDVGAHVAQDLGAAFAERGLGASDAVPRMVEAGLLGRKNGRGFYQYEGERKQINTEAYRFFGGAERKLSSPPREWAERLALMMVNEAVYCLGEDVITSARDGDIGAIMGLGFPPFLGGPFHWVDAQGTAAVVAKLRDFATRFGPRFTPAPLLVEMAERQERFYPALETPVGATT